MTKRNRVRLKSKQRDTRKNHTVRFNDAEAQEIIAHAMTYTEGNVSEWIRYAALHYKPQVTELEKLS